MKKVLFIADSLKSGGVEKVLVNVLKYLSADDNFSIDLLLIDAKPTQKIEKVNIILAPKEVNELLSLKNKNIVKKIMLAIGIPKLFLMKRYHNLSLGDKIRCFAIDKYIHIDKEYDCAIAFNVSHLLYLLDKKISARKKIVWFHGDANDTKNVHVDKYKNLINHMDDIVCVSEKSKHSIKKYVYEQQKIKVIRNLLPVVEKSSNNPFKDKKTINILAVGRLSSEKGYKQLLYDYNKVRLSTNKKTHLYIIGDGPEKKSLQKQIRVLNMTNDVSLLGYIDDVYNYMKHCDIFVHPSKFEGFGIAIYEAAFSGCCVLCYDVSDTRKDSKTIKNINVVNSSEEFQKKLTELISNPIKNCNYSREYRAYNNTVMNSINELFYEEN